MSLGTAVKYHREARNLTQDFVAKKLGMSQVNYSRMERNEIRIKPDKIKELAELFEIDPQELESAAAAGNFHLSGNAGQHGHFSVNQNINYYGIDKHVQKMYEDQIELLKDKVSLLQEKIVVYEKTVKNV